MTSPHRADGTAPAGQGRTNAQVSVTDHLVAPAKAIRVLGALRRGLDELDEVDLDPRPAAGWPPPSGPR